MLRAMDCKPISLSRKWMSPVVLTMLVVFAVTSTAVRGVAEGENEPGATGAKPVAENETIAQVSFTDSTYFQRQKISSTHPAFKHHGAVYLDVTALKSTKLWPLLVLALTEQKPGDNNPINFNSIKTIAADCLLTVRPRQGETKGQVMFGASGARIEFNQEINWPKAVNALFADSIEIHQDNRLMFEATIPAAGPWPVRICPLDSREVAVNSQPPEKRGDSSSWLTPSDAERQHSWAQEWDAVAGGLFTIVMTRVTSDQPISDLKFSGIEEVNLLNRTIDLIAIGIDFQGKSDKFGVIVRFGCKADEDPESVLSAMKQLFALEKEEFLKEEASSKDSELSEDFHVHQMLVRGISDAKTQIIRGERNLIDVRFELKLPSALTQFAAEPERAAKEVKQAAEPPSDSTRK